ncbi:hypothetical protein [Mycoplasma sp. CR]
MNKELLKGYKKIRDINIAIIVEICLIIIFFILWFVLFAIKAASFSESAKNGNGNSTGAEVTIESLGAVLAPMILAILSCIACGISYVINIAFTCIWNTSNKVNAEHENASTLVWIGFILTFCIPPIGNIIAIIGASKAIKALKNVQTNQNAIPVNNYSKDIF